MQFNNNDDDDSNNDSNNHNNSNNNSFIFCFVLFFLYLILLFLWSYLLYCLIVSWFSFVCFIWLFVIGFSFIFGFLVYYIYDTEKVLS